MSEPTARESNAEVLDREPREPLAATGVPEEAFDALAYLTAPRWQKVSLGLDRMLMLLGHLGNPQDDLRFVHVAGTNGKGSTCALLAAVLQRAGYKVGLFTSPALYAFEDRIRVDGVPISPDQLHEVTLQVRAAAEVMPECDHPTEFELLTAVAFEHFAREACDIVIAEVGLGGRLDSTNVIRAPELSVITPVSFDHRALLGDTLEQIAREKAGIIKPRVPVVLAPQQQAAQDAIEHVAHQLDASVESVDLSALSGTTASFSYHDHSNLELGLSGTFQLVNAATALEALDVLRARGWDIPEQAVREGLKQARWPGRFEVVSDEPLIIFDGGHNTAGLEALERALHEGYPHYARIVLTGVLADKEYEEMARCLVRFADAIITVAPHNPRALEASAYASALERAAAQMGRSVKVSAALSIEEGVRCALRLYDRFLSAPSGSEETAVLSAAGSDALICVCGSLYLLGSVMEVLRHDGVVL